MVPIVPENCEQCGFIDRLNNSLEIFNYNAQLVKMTMDVLNKMWMIDLHSASHSSSFTDNSLETGFN